MTLLVVVLMAVAGGLGAAARFVVDGFIGSRTRMALPVGTILINLSGSLLLGIVAGLVLNDRLSADTMMVVGTGFLGGFTTFSAASVETVRLIHNGRAGVALLNVIVTVALSLGAVAGGLALLS